MTQTAQSHLFNCVLAVRGVAVGGVAVMWCCDKGVLQQGGIPVRGCSSKGVFQ